MKKLINCAWCQQETDLPMVYAADSPLLRWIEEKINAYCYLNKIDRSELWGDNSDWGKLQLPEGFEAELLTYDALLSTVTRKHICKHCLIEDHLLWSKFYGGMDDNTDLEFIIDELK